MLTHSDQPPSSHNEPSQIPELPNLGTYGLPLEIGAQTINGVMHEDATEVDFDQRLVAEAIETHHFVKVAPRLAEQVADISRTNTFEHSGREHLGIPGGTMTEHDGLVNLMRAIDEAIQEAAWSDSLHPHAVEELADIGTNLTFIGEKEYQEGARGLAALWKQYLNENSKNTICVPLTLSKPKGTRKSDDYLLEQILATFTNEEIEHYEGRIVGGLDRLTSPPEHTRVVILDDWSVSGAQVGDIYANLSHKPNFGKYKDRIEVNNLVASAERIEQGLVTRHKHVPVPLPVKAYYKAHEADAPDTNARITGTHSSVDYGFKYGLEYAIRKIYNPSEDDSLKSEVPYVPLANVVRAYRNSAPQITLSSDGVIRRISA